jgi:gamma-glutamylcyclotransferase (GGCT)/AIG2-like uncharacterized protein YtfP
MARATVRLFVYGSLKREGRHHDELEAAGATFLGEAETWPGYRLVALNETDDYLALVHAGLNAPNVVSGELFELPESRLPALDAFEGDAYTRAALKVRLKRPNAGEAGENKGTDAGMESLAYFRKAR